jgi:hypothetical protein
MKKFHLNKKIATTLKTAAELLTGPERRIFIGKATTEHFSGSPRLAERVLGWGRATIIKGMREVHSGITCIDDYRARGNIRSEVKNKDLERDIRLIAERRSQADPSLKSDRVYTKITSRFVANTLKDEMNYSSEEIPCDNTIGNILNRLGYNLKRVQKTKPLKKIKEVDAIFENVHAANLKSDQDPSSLRISIDSKAHLKLGELSRDGKSRDLEPKKALDHDMQHSGTLVPFGILAVSSGQLTISFGTSNETSDFIADAIEAWWADNKNTSPGVTQLVINLDNGPQIASNRTQFIRRMVEFSEQSGLNIRLLYYPPYHSKYNPIERCWGILETHWNGELLDSVAKVLNLAGSMTWKGIKPVVTLSEKIYKNGIKLTKKEIQPYLEKCARSLILPKWDLCINTYVG